MTLKISQKQIESVLKLDAPKRYMYSIKRIADQEEIWGLYNDGWALAADEGGNVVFPLWPAKEYAQLSAHENWNGYEPEPISLDDLINALLPRLMKDHIQPSIFYTPADKGIVLDASALIDDLNKELENYT